MVILAAVQWGLWPLVLYGAREIHPTLQATIMMIVIIVVTGAFVPFDRVRVKATPMQWLGIGWLGIGDAANVLLLFFAYKTTTVGIAVTTHYLAPILVASLSPLVLRERPSRRTWLAVAIALSGLILMVRLWADDLSRADMLGAAYGTGSAIAYASNVLVNKRLIPAFSGTELMFWHAVVAAPILAFFVPHDAWHLDVRPFQVLLLGSIGPGAIGGLLFVVAIRKIPASHAMTLTLLEPLTAFVVGIAALHQTFQAVSVIGGALILIAAALVLGGNSTADP
jgi:drug/metabolite transporter (DMT)-like permease